MAMVCLCACSVGGSGEYGFLVIPSTASKETKAVDWTVSSFFLSLLLYWYFVCLLKFAMGNYCCCFCLFLTL